LFHQSVELLDVHRLRAQSESKSGYENFFSPTELLGSKFLNGHGLPDGTIGVGDTIVSVGWVRR
jgi:hypothetical protein